MHLSDLTKIIATSVPLTVLESDLAKIRTNCTQFLSESGNNPVYKSLRKNNSFIKVKARLRRDQSMFSETFNNAFGNNTNLRQKAIFAHGQQLTEHNSYYLFPINGYQYVYNTQIVDSTSLIEVQSSLHDATDVFTELLQSNYSNTNLLEGITSGSELLFHNIPFCYAINTQTVNSYDELLSFIG